MKMQDQYRDNILRFLYERHGSAKSPATIPIGIRDLQKAMKADFGMKQQEVAANLDYLIQAGWVREVVRQRSFKTKGGMEVGQEQVKYKISDIGINHLETATVFERSEAARSINITNIRGVTVLGDGNVVNTEFTELSRALDELETAVASSPELGDEEKLDLAGDISTIRTQIAKKNPDPTIVEKAWRSMARLADVGGTAELLVRAGVFVESLLASLG